MQQIYKSVFNEKLAMLGKPVINLTNVVRPTARYIHSSNHSIMAPPTIYRNVESVLSILTNNKPDSIQAVTSLLQIYDNALSTYKKEYDEKDKKYPLIILEGLDGSGKSTVGKKLAAKLNAAKWCTPPRSIQHIRHLFDDHRELRTAYYALGNYIAALEVAVILKKQPVIMDRFWHSTAAFAVAQAVHDFPGEVEIPPEGDGFYHWPSDLMKPDAVLFLNVSEHIRIQRLSKRITSTNQEDLLKTSSNFRNNIILAYRNMVDPGVTFINADGYFKSVLEQIDNKIGNLLQ